MAMVFLPLFGAISEMAIDFSGSDGVSDMVPVDFLETMMQQTQSTAKCVDAILTAALDAGGKDNITAIVLEINR